MTSEVIPETSCLGVAIDHRIRRLFQPVASVPSSAPRGGHVSRIGIQGLTLKKQKDEIQVTRQLAGPNTTGGIAIALQQPSDYHPFGDGVNAVVDSSPTLSALGDLFAVVSCGTLDIISDISVIDLLPYTTEGDMEEMDAKMLRNGFQTSTEVFSDKKPDVLLCAGKIWLKKLEMFQDDFDAQKQCKGDAWQLESIGIGKIFDKYAHAKIHDENKSNVRIRRVNGFHPSHAIRYNPHQSCLIQLLLLIVSETCGILRGDWKEEEWMRYLRVKCSELPKESGLYFLSDYADHYGLIIDKIREEISDIAGSNSETYNGLLESALSEQLNNASLVLQVMGSQDGIPSKILKQAARYTISLTTASWKGNGWLRSRDIKQLILNGIEVISLSVQDVQNLTLDPRVTSKAFFDAAEAIELFLWDQPQFKKDTAANYSHTEPDDIADRIETSLKLDD
ncbi:uncharacterized protein TRUGW13939_11805 [Talaromyces rugulosus]|uniref:Uncharacterized protein n=1 Tax=Talaromyces rugulosus TaxID=121627 RepID=A0A7H8RDR8_TALRU|nr:uncharacterized protein TRUGW13939_11805 [Talaromyces rugulosus]QKX64630.1 hypothetical protein TRUGW13939_11805 [Talaromyces rugulosus]